MKNKFLNKINMLKSALLSLLLAVLLNSCNYLDITPVGQVIPTKSTEYRALLNSAYSSFPRHKVLLNMRGTHYDPQDDPFGMGLDGFDMFKDIYTWNDSNPDYDKTQEYPYMSFYRVIFLTNEIITNGPKATQDGVESISQIIGEAFALRAYCYFELANMYAVPYGNSTAASSMGVPVTTKIDVEQVFPKQSLESVYFQIISDMESALVHMDVEKVSGMDRFKFSLEALYAMQSRVYLYMGEWEKSAQSALRALELGSELEDMNDASYRQVTHYLSKEAIMSLEYISSIELRDYAAISYSLQSSYSSADLRPSKYFAESWFGYLISDKLGSTNERVSFRRAEVYLNISEALAQLGRDDQAKEYLKTLMINRYTSAGYSAVLEKLNSLSGASLIEFILEERERELALEGHQWYDLRRTTQPQITKMVKGESYTLSKNDPRYTLQFPKSAREANPEL